MTFKEKILVNALSSNFEYSPQRNIEAANMIERLAASRDMWKRRAETAEKELRGACWCCAKAQAIKIAPGHVVYACSGLKEQAEGYSEWRCKHWQLRGRSTKTRGDDHEVN